MLARTTLALLTSTLLLGCKGGDSERACDRAQRFGADVAVDCELAAWTDAESRCVGGASDAAEAWACVSRGAFAGAPAPATAWTDVRRRDHAGERCGSESEARPAWVASDARLGASCREDGGGLSCVGVSSFAERRPEAEGEARAAAYDALGAELTARLESASMAPALTPGRDAREQALEAWEAARTAPDDVYGPALARVLAGRAETARRLQARLGDAVDEETFWEVYKERGARRFLSFVQVRVPSAALAALTEHHGQASDMLGARLGVTGPLHAWFDGEYPDGVVVLDPGAGAYAAAGITPGAVVIAGHDRKPVPDPPTLIAQCQAAEPQSFITVAVRRDPGKPPVTFDVRLDGAAPVATAEPPTE